MDARFQEALAAGTERLAGWADLLDGINVFPVADGDTGRNLVLSLAPLRQTDAGSLPERLLMAARGNSGNIAARFFSGLLQGRSLDGLPAAVRKGREMAWEALPDPRSGTMLTLFDCLCDALSDHPPEQSEAWVAEILCRLRESVLSTTHMLDKLEKAGVVDSGALGMYLFFEGFLQKISGREVVCVPLSEAFGGRLALASGWAGEAPVQEGSCCIDAVIEASDSRPDLERRVAGMGESVVAVRDGRFMKVHLHVNDEQMARRKLAELGNVVSWAADDLREQTERFASPRLKPALHVVTDAAGSVSREEAARLGMTLLDSYICVGSRSVPETHLGEGDLYGAMRRGDRVSTSQASVAERHHHYQKALDLWGRALYLCVGSVFTGNWRVVMEWKRQHDPDGLLHVVDSGAACGRLGLMAQATARFSLRASDPGEVVRFAERAVSLCRGYAFLDRLEWLASGGRLSKTKAFLGDMMHKKPVISPYPDGARKVAVLASRQEQVAFAIERLRMETAGGSPLLVLLEYTDNEAWVREVPGSEVRRLRPQAEILLQRMSLTSGAHMGPGTWGMAFLPDWTKEAEHGL